MLHILKKQQQGSQGWLAQTERMHQGSNAGKYGGKAMIHIKI
jgi:hypothetical protein